MIDFLDNCNLKKETLKELSKKYPSELFDLNSNEDECIEIIKYLRNIGINCVDELLLHRIDIFYNSKNEIQNKFMKYNINEVVAEINNDYTKIDELF